MRQLKIVTHFNEDDPQFLSDYASVEVFLDDRFVASYGDAYHDRGRERAEGFADGVIAVLGPDAVEVAKENVADYV